MKILVTGGGGFLGSEICKQLLEANHILYSAQRSFSQKLEQMGVKQIQVDLSLKQECDKALSQLVDIDAVFHTAAKAGVWGNYKSYYSANVQATENILAWSKNQKIQYFIYTSTPSVVFGKDYIENADETLPYPEWFLTFYAQTKAMAEKIILSSHSKNFQVACIRPHLIFGPGDPHIIPRIIARAKKRKLIQVGSGQNLVDVIHVTNAAHAHLCAFNYLLESKEHGGKAYFVGQERPVPLWWFIHKILEYKRLPPISKSISVKFAYTIGLVMEIVFRLLPFLGEPPMTRFLAMQLGASHYFNQSQAIQDLAYRPKLSIEDGLMTI